MKKIKGGNTACVSFETEGSVFLFGVAEPSIHSTGARAVRTTS